jgi:hypothetical protein
MNVLNVVAEDEKNKLTDIKWKKLYGDITITEENIDGVNTVAMSGMNTTYDSMAIDILPIVTDMMGEDDSVDIWIVFDIRVDSKVGGDFPFGVRIRTAGVTDQVKEMDAFVKNYYQESQNFMNNGKGQISKNLFSDGIATNEWQRIEIQLTFNEIDVNKEFWNQWNLCFDTLTKYKDMTALQIKNIGIYLYEDYDSREDDDPITDVEKEPEYVLPVTPEPAKVYRPYDFNKYSATFIDVVEQEGVQITQAPMISPDTAKNDHVGTFMLIGATVGTVVIILAVAVIFIVKKKRKVESE